MVRLGGEIQLSDPSPPRRSMELGKTFQGLIDKSSGPFESLAEGQREQAGLSAGRLFWKAPHAHKRTPSEDARSQSRR